jgi:octaprenyl-diphosphate synthase
MGLKLQNYHSTGGNGAAGWSAMHDVLAPPREAVAARLSLFAPIARDLDEVEAVLSRTLASSRPYVRQLVEHLGHYRGKRLRPALLLLTARACGPLTPAHHTLGAVVEMIHTATLVHDDVLDSASVRRHVATVNAGWGNQSSVLLGDFLFTHAFHLSSTVGDVRACRIIGAATNRVCEGELHQVGQRGNLALGEEEYFAIIEAKTAELTACCCRLGALFSGAPAELVEGLARYGRWLGIAFQIADDLLDLVGEEQAAGKSLGTDLEQQKMTLPLIRLLAGAAPEQASLVRQLLRAPGNHKREALDPYLRESGALAYARQQAEEFAARARAELDALPPSECRTILQTLTDRVVHRNS